MFKMLGKIAEAGVALAISAPAAVVDTFMVIPDSVSSDPRRDLPYSRTAAAIKHAADCLEEAVTPDKK